MLKLILAHPGIYLQELQKKLSEDYGVVISVKPICRTLKEMGCTRQSIHHAAREILIFIDETGADRRNLLRRCGYSIRGQPAKNHKLLYRGPHISVIATMSVKGVLHCKIVTDSITGDTFYDFVLSNLLAHLQPFDGCNSHCVVILNNVSIHHTRPAVSAMEETGVLVQFLPLYFPNYNYGGSFFQSENYHENTIGDNQ